MDAHVAGDAVAVSAPSVPQPAAVRYAWDMNVDVNFYNSSATGNLPGAPFRTDGRGGPGVREQDHGP